MKQSLPPGKIPGALLSDLLARYPMTDSRVLIGPGTGHDSAAISFGDTALVLKTDPITFITDQPAHHLIHVNANDIACQGATPKWLLVTVLLPAGLVDAEAAKDLFEQLQVVAQSVGVSIVGGHTEITNGLDRPLLIGTMLGEVEIARLVRPSDAKPGDRILMTRSAGIEGTAILGMEAESKGVSPEIAARARAFIHSPGISVLAAARS
ncbi:MAG TPA: AIR synthase related protein, partial [Thermomicrobiales bacterium]|nr:AIR synthase related protein [Thermomicrobiales bacterium]